MAADEKPSWIVRDRSLLARRKSIARLQLEEAYRVAVLGFRVQG